MGYIGELSQSGAGKRMFRRFMIVCWVLFALCICVVGFGMLAHDKWFENWESASQAIHEHPAYVGNLSAQEWENSGPDQDKVTDASGRTVASLEFEREIASRAMEEYSELVGFMVVVAALILLWNIIWHVGHWIWMGREVR